MTPPDPVAPSLAVQKARALERIEHQRSRLREQRAQRQQARAAIAQAERVAGLGPDAPFATRLRVFARLHPVVVAVVAAAAVALGPRRSLGWIGTLLPMLLRRRGR